MSTTRLHTQAMSLFSGVLGSIPLTVSALPKWIQDIYYRVKEFIEMKVIPLEPEFDRHIADADTKWSVFPPLETLKVRVFLEIYTRETQQPKALDV